MCTDFKQSREGKGLVNQLDADYTSKTGLTTLYIGFLINKYDIKSMNDIDFNCVDRVTI